MLSGSRDKVTAGVFEVGRQAILKHQQTNDLTQWSVLPTSIQGKSERTVFVIHFKTVVFLSEFQPPPNRTLQRVVFFCFEEPT